MIQQHQNDNQTTTVELYLMFIISSHADIDDVLTRSSPPSLPCTDDNDTHGRWWIERTSPSCPYGGSGSDGGPFGRITFARKSRRAE